MDISEKYIKMCEKAKEIQEQWEPKVGDFVYTKVYNKIGILCAIELSHGGVCQVQYVRKIKDRDFFEDEVWLPRQDQLQEMLDNFTMGAKIREFFYFYEPEMRCLEDPTCEDCKQQGLYARKTFDSIEQLWLGFIMRGKYNKVWNGKKVKWEEVK